MNSSCDFCTPLEPQKVMDALIARLVNRYGIAAAGIWRLNHGQSALSLAATAGGPQFPASLQEISASQSLLGRAAQAKSSQVYPGSAADGDELAQWAGQNQFRFLSAFPLADDSKTAGVLVAGRPRNPRRIDSCAVPFARAAGFHRFARRGIVRRACSTIWSGFSSWLRPARCSIPPSTSRNC